MDSVILPVLCADTVIWQGDDILHGFIYPDSRAQLIAMLKQAELLDALKANEKIAESPSLIHDFWSYTKGL